MTARKDLLDKLILTLIEEWGSQQVESAVFRAIREQHGELGKGPSRYQMTGQRGNTTRKLNATQQVEKAGANGERREVLLTIAEQFDRKHFLPSIADVREFLILSGKRPVGLKDRAEAFRTLLRMLLDMPQEKLADLSQAAMTGGPSQLGPISDAISAAGERLHRYQAPNDRDTPTT